MFYEIFRDFRAFRGQMLVLSVPLSIAQINLHSPLIAMNTAKFKKLATFEQGARISNAGLTIDNGGITVTAGLSYLNLN